MANSININALAEEIANALTEYGQEVQNGVSKSAKKVASKTVKTLKATSPKNTGKYAKGWRAKAQNEFANATSYVVHNATDYQLTHLLENGHANANGGRTSARPHIRQAEEQAIEEFTQEVEGVIQSGNGNIV